MKTYYKTIFFLVIQFFFIDAYATNYYLSNIGNDENNGTNPASAWKSLNKLNTFTNLFPGDSVLFRRGDTFYGKIILANTYGPNRNSGTAAYPIVFSAYGQGEMPIITGFTDINAWKKLDGNIWESTVAISELPTCNMVAINGVSTPMGRYPNTGWKPILNSTKTTLTDNVFSTKNWTGGELVARVERPVIDKYAITSQSGKTIHFTPNVADGYLPKTNWGFFIQNHPATLDIVNEWYYHPQSKKLRIYNTKEPKAVQATTIDTLVTILVTNFLTFENIHFSGANKNIFVIGSSRHITIQNCAFTFAGENAIWGKNFWQDFDSDSLKIISNSFANSNNFCIYLENEKRNATISHNKIDETAMIAGAGVSGDAKGIAIMASGENSVIENNLITNSGYTAIYFQGNGTIVRHNFIDHFCMIKDDGGGIYTWTPNIESAYHGMKILENIILNGKGNIIGISDGNAEIWTDGIYLDNHSSYIEVAGNTIAHCSRAGIFPYRGQGNNIHHNVCFSNQSGIRFQDDLGSVKNDTIRENIFISKYSYQFPASFYAPKNNIYTFGAIDNNYYIKPLSGTAPIEIATGAGSNYRRELLNLPNWQARYKFDIHSKLSPVAIIPFSYSPMQPNRISNGTFNTDIKGLSWWPANNGLLVSWNNNNKINGGSVQVSYSTPTAASMQPGISIPIGEVSSKNKYILLFSTIASIDNKTIYASIKNNEAPWQELATVQAVITHKNKTDHALLFALPKSAASATVSFTWNAQDLKDKFWMDNVAFYEAKAVETNVDEYLLFEYNATGVNKTITLSGNYFDVWGKIRNGKITLAPYESIVLIKDKNVKKEQ